MRKIKDRMDDNRCDEVLEPERVMTPEEECALLGGFSEKDKKSLCVGDRASVEFWSGKRDDPEFCADEAKEALGWSPESHELQPVDTSSQAFQDAVRQCEEEIDEVLTGLYDDIECLGCD